MQGAKEGEGERQERGGERQEIGCGGEMRGERGKGKEGGKEDQERGH